MGSRARGEELGATAPPAWVYVKSVRGVFKVLIDESRDGLTSKPPFIPSSSLMSIS